MSKTFVVVTAMALSKVTLVISLFLPSVRGFFVTIARGHSVLSRPVFPTVKIFVHHVVSDMVAITSSLVSHISFTMTAVKARLLLSAVILVVVSGFQLAMH